MLKVELLGKTLKNPVIAASGTFGFGEEYHAFYDVGRLGGIATKGLTLREKQGNEGLRVWETPSGMMNSVGLQNPGVDRFIENELPKMEQLNTLVFANLGGSTLEDYLEGVLKLNDTSVDFIELNISCPNVKSGGMAFGIKSSVAREVVAEVKKVCKKPLIVKLSPNAEDIVDMALACEAAGADGLSLVNTFKGMAIDIHRRKPVFDNITAGLSGPAIKPLALRMVYEVCGAVQIPVIGMGGIMSGEDAIEFIMAGATAIQVGTANFVKPDICIDIINGMEAYMAQEKIEHISELRDVLRRK